MLHDKRYYIFLDFPKGEALRETGIPLYKDKKGIPNLDEDEMKAILKKQFKKDRFDMLLFGQPKLYSTLNFRNSLLLPE